jgi:hypothetical protein
VNLGSPGRQDYTAIDDTTNAAGHIEGENKRLDTEILICSAMSLPLSTTERECLGCAVATEVTRLLACRPGGQGL